MLKLDDIIYASLPWLAKKKKRNQSNVEGSSRQKFFGGDV